MLTFFLRFLGGGITEAMLYLHTLGYAPPPMQMHGVGGGGGGGWVQCVLLQQQRQ